MPIRLRNVLPFSTWAAIIGTLLIASLADAQRLTSVLPASSPGWDASRRGPDVPAFWVRPGYKVTLVAKNLGNARFMAFDDRGDLFLSRPERGDILTLRKRGASYARVATFVSGYKSVHGLCFRSGWLWFTTSGAVYKAHILPNGTGGSVTTVLTGLPSGGHWWRSILVTKHGFFTSIGDSSNIGDETKTDREKVWKYSLDGKSRVLWCGGIRNTEKLEYQPGTHNLYGCDEGSDNFGHPLGETQGSFMPVTNWNPPEEFNLYQKGKFYGHPFVVGDNIPRYEYMHKPDILQIAEKSIPPIWEFPAHWAAVGWTFLKTNGLGAGFKGDALIAFHGSWDRTIRAGYRIEHVLFDKVTGMPMGDQMMVGLLSQNFDVLGRPADVVEAPDGSTLFSDDMRNCIYRLAKVGK